MADEVFQERIILTSVSMTLGVLNAVRDSHVNRARREKQGHTPHTRHSSGWMIVTWKPEQHTEIREYTQLLQGMWRWSQNGGGCADTTGTNK